MVPNGRFGLFIWENCFFLNFLLDFELSNNERLAKKMDQGCWSFILLGQWNFSLGNIFRETFSFAIVSGLRKKHQRSFGNNFLTVSSKLHSSFRKEIFGGKAYILGKDNSLYVCFGTLSKTNELLEKIFQQGCQIRNLHVQRIFLRKNCFFFEGNNFFHHNFWIVARHFCRFRDFFPQGCQNCTLQIRKNFSEENIFLSKTLRYKKNWDHLDIWNI